MELFRRRTKKAQRMLKGKGYGHIMRSGIIAGALYGAELNNYKEAYVAAMNTAVFASERADVGGVPNFIKEVVLGPEKLPSFKVAASSIKTFAREIRLRADKCRLDPHWDDALTAKEIVEVWHALNNDDEERRHEESDPINLLRQRMGFFEVYMPNPVQMVTGQGTLDLDATSAGKHSGQVKDRAIMPSLEIEAQRKTPERRNRRSC